MAHMHDVYDTDTHFKMDAATRTLKNESSAKTILVQHDHNSERFTFEIPRYVESHDISLCTNVEIHYLNIDAKTKVQNAGLYVVDDLKIKENDANTVILSWLVSQDATRYAGSLDFLIRFSCVAEDGTIDYAWSTCIYNGVTVSSGIFNG